MQRRTRVKNDNVPLALMISPVFGELVDGYPHIIRPGAYALVLNDERRIAVVRTPSGWFLPGGGSDVGESPEETVVRETMEECGLEVEVIGVVTRATEIVVSIAENACFEKPSVFISARCVGTTSQVEDDHELHWVDLDEATDLLSHGSHRWGVEMLRI